MGQQQSIQTSNTVVIRDPQGHALSAGDASVFKCSCIAWRNPYIAYKNISLYNALQLSDAAELLKRSFPLPLVTDVADPICASNATIYPHLCGPQELAVYLKVPAISTAAAGL